MSLTAAGLDQNEILRPMGIQVYEAAADAAVLSGSLGFYLSCQSRLLRDLYPGDDTKRRPGRIRAMEFLGQSIIFFSAASPDGTELACLMRDMTVESFHAPDVRFALKVASYLASCNFIDFFRLYGTAKRRQKVLMNPAVDRLRSTAIAMLVRSYRFLSVSTVANWLDVHDESQVREILFADHPYLKSVNLDSEASSLCFVRSRGEG
jgi:SAC3 family protein LENG8/THP3